MFFTGTNSTMIPNFTSAAAAADAVTMGVSNVQNAVRTPPTLWQYPSKFLNWLFYYYALFFFLNATPCSQFSP